MKLIRKIRETLPIYLVFFLCFTHINSSAQNSAGKNIDSKLLTDTSSYVEIALITDTSKHLNNLKDSNTIYTDEMLEVFLEEEQEIEQNIESWMIDNAYFRDLLIEKHVSEEQVEDEPEIEGWMLDEGYWD